MEEWRGKGKPPVVLPACLRLRSEGDTCFLAVQPREPCIAYRGAGASGMDGRKPKAPASHDALQLETVTTSDSGRNG